MIEKKEETSSPSSSNANSTDSATSLAHSHQLLQLTTHQVQTKLRESFARLTETLQSREKQLLRQIEVLHSQQIALLQSQLSHPTSCNGLIPQVVVDISQEKSLCESIQSFGKVDVEGGNLIAIEGNMAPISVPYRVEDYQDAKEDHVCLYKPLSNHSTPQQQVVRFSFAPRLKDCREIQQTKLDGSGLSLDTDSAETQYENHQSVSETQEPANDSLIGNREKPSQVQQWLQEIMVETEIEPSIGEQEKNFTSVGGCEELVD
ncbi:uncharacterized protein [Periplaneta americana]|uniref:uncharacterized protein isoform X2 n=1 Tax=Periplaneta americana TaxID=6978 RepID=UPI0037E78404